MGEMWGNGTKMSGEKGGKREPYLAAYQSFEITPLPLSPSRFISLHLPEGVGKSNRKFAAAALRLPFSRWRHVRCGLFIIPGLRLDATPASPSFHPAAQLALPSVSSHATDSLTLQDSSHSGLACLWLDILHFLDFQFSRQIYSPSRA